MTRPDEFTRIYFDANIFTHMFNRDSKYHAVVGQLVALVDQRQLELVVSPIVYIEALGQSPGAPVDEQREASILALIQDRRVRTQEFNLLVAERARNFILRRSMPKWDALHLASAIEARCQILFTTDNGDYPVGSEVDGVWIDHPYLPGDPTIFDQDE